jgi:hypothetical protein
MSPLLVSFLSIARGPWSVWLHFPTHSPESCTELKTLTLILAPDHDLRHGFVGDSTEMSLEQSLFDTEGSDPPETSPETSQILEFASSAGGYDQLKLVLIQNHPPSETC